MLDKTQSVFSNLPNLSMKDVKSENMEGDGNVIYENIYSEVNKDD